jgi:hypothetical protein
MVFLDSLQDRKKMARDVNRDCDLDTTTVLAVGVGDNTPEDVADTQSDNETENCLSFIDMYNLCGGYGGGCL